MKNFCIGMVKQERVSWVSALATGVIGCYYFWNVPVAIVGEFLYTREMRKVIMTCFVLMTLGEILVAIVSRSRSGLVDEDERDELIRTKALGVAYRTMLGFVVLLIGHIVFYQGLGAAVGETAATQFPTLGELGVANALLGVLILSSLVQQIAKVIYYRRGY